MKILPLLLLLPAIASAQPLILPPTDTPTAIYDANGQRYDLYPSPFGSVVITPGNERLEVYKKPSGGTVIYDQHGVRIFESYPSTLEKDRE